MQLVARQGRREREVDVALAAGATLADLRRALLAEEGDTAPRRLFVDGRLFSADLPVVDAGVAAGAVLSGEGGAAADDGVVELGVVAGTGAGMSLRLDPGLHVIGSGAGANVALRAPGVRTCHAMLRVSPEGRVSVAAGPGRWRALAPVALLRIAGCLLSCGPVAEPTDKRLRPIAGRRGTIPFNRPPRRRPMTEPPVVTIPGASPPPPPRSRVGMAALVVPILFGLTMALVVHPRMALFAFLGPVMMLAQRLDDRRRARRFRRRSAQEADAAAAAVGAALDRARVTEALRRHSSFPTLPAIVARSKGAHGLWERRPTAPDFMQLVAGYGRPVWRPPLVGDPAEAAEPVRRVLTSHSRLPATAVAVALHAGRVCGIAGPRGGALELARSLVAQAAVCHGPADLRIAVVTDRPESWDWAKWLPHTTADGAGERRLLAGAAEEMAHVVAMLTTPAPQAARAGLLRTAPPAPTEMGDEPLTLLVVDVPDLAVPALAGVRLLLSGRGGPVAGVVVAEAHGRLPSVCTSVVVVGERSALCTGSEDGEVAVVAAGLSEPLARTVSRNIARYEDPERLGAGAELPASVDLLPLLGMARPSPAAIAARWAGGRSVPAAAPIGVTEAGPLLVDLVRDGPHALLAGTTGSGKSELLRTLVASLAASVSPQQLTFVLIDYKGGSAFDACADLPHTVGLVTDLDDRLAARALRCLEAELRHREARLRDAGVEDLAALPAADGADPLPRMLIVIDEFAALARELPEFMDALVDIAARGRSLGVHLLLATQRPAGVIRGNVRANTNLRIALRVQDHADSADVIEDAGAAAIARSQPGRGFVRLGPGEVIPFQAARVTTPACRGGAVEVRTRSFRFAPEQEPFASGDAASAAGDGPTQLELIVAAAQEAAGEMRPMRRPWPDPLPTRLVVADLPWRQRPSPWAVPLGLRDEPDRQRQVTHWWSPDDGSLVLFGVTGSGTTTALSTIACGLGGRGSPSQLHAYVLDFDARATAPLSGLPHVGAVVGPSQRERQVRLIRRLAAEVDRRRGEPEAGGARRGRKVLPRIVLFLDNFAGFTAAFDPALDGPLRDALGRIITEGSGVGVVSVVTASRTGAVPLALAGAFPNKLVLRMADPLAATSLGLSRPTTGLPDGRAVDVATGREVQIALPSPDGIAAAVAESAPVGAEAVGGPPPVDELPARVPLERVRAHLRLADDEWFVPVGIGDIDLAVVGFTLHPGDHVLVAGEPRSGRSTALAGIAAVALGAQLPIEVTAVAVRPSPLRELPAAATVVTDPDRVAAVLDDVVSRSGAQLVLIDDAEGVDDPGVLRRLAASRRPDLHVIAAGRRDLKAHYRHWAKELCRSRVGLWLRPGPGLDGDLWSTPMPRHIPPGVPAGRGFLVGAGSVELIQVAQTGR